jgi:hypothetical protein
VETHTGTNEFGMIEEARPFEHPGPYLALLKWGSAARPAPPPASGWLPTCARGPVNRARAPPRRRFPAIALCMRFGCRYG